MTDYARLKSKCSRDSNGCWNWLGGMGGWGARTPLFHCPLKAGAKRSIAAYKAAWTLSGRTIPPGHWVYRTCTNVRCVNPSHCATGTPAEMGAHARKTGQQRGTAAKRVAARLTALRRAYPREKVERAMELIDGGMPLREVAAECGIGIDTASLIKRGRHVHQRPFAWAPGL